MDNSFVMSFIERTIIFSRQKLEDTMRKLLEKIRQELGPCRSSLWVRLQKRAAREKHRAAVCSRD